LKGAGRLSPGGERLRQEIGYAIFALFALVAALVLWRYKTRRRRRPQSLRVDLFANRER
jgi:hypothetical protein